MNTLENESQMRTLFSDGMAPQRLIDPTSKVIIVIQYQVKLFGPILYF